MMIVGLAVIIVVNYYHTIVLVAVLFKTYKVLKHTEPAKTAWKTYRVESLKHTVYVFFL